MRKQGLCAQNTPIHITVCICIRYSKPVSCIRFPMKCCINGKKCVRILSLFKKLFNFKIQKCGQILCCKYIALVELISYSNYYFNLLRLTHVRVFYVKMHSSR